MRTLLSVVTLTMSLLTASVAHATAESRPLNGSSPRPFYNMGHNTNTLQQAELALEAGANALEIDVSSYDDCTVLFPTQQPLVLALPLVVEHDVSCFALAPGGVEDPSAIPRLPADNPPLASYLQGLHALATQHPELAMIMFDIKSTAATANHGTQILDLIHAFLNTGPVDLNVILSVASVPTASITADGDGDGSVFNHFLGKLRPREGVQVDQEDDVNKIVQFFGARGQSHNITYGDGTSAVGPSLPRALDEANFRRASLGSPDWSYVWTLSFESSMEFFINSGADGIIADEFGFPGPVDNDFITELGTVIANHPEIRLATREDNPFQPALESYGLEIKTANAGSSGTDANLTFTLTGCNGTATKTIDTGNVHFGLDSGRMRKGNTDFVTIPSMDLGELLSITVSNDGTGFGGGWEFTNIRVSSDRWIGQDNDGAREYVATPAEKLDSHETVDLLLVRNFADPLVCTGSGSSALVKAAGFEDPGSWSSSPGGVLSSSPEHTEGAHSLAVGAAGYTSVKSVPLSSLHRGPVHTISFDLFLPASQVNPWWFGDSQLFVEIPSLGLFNQYGGIQSLQPLQPGA